MENLLTTTNETSIKLPAAIESLRAKGMTAQDIEEALEHRVTARTVYRWEKGQTGPQSQPVLECMRELVKRELGIALDCQVKTKGTRKRTHAAVTTAAVTTSGDALVP